MLNFIAKQFLLFAFMMLLCALDIWGYFFFEHQYCYVLLSFLIAYSWYYDSLMTLIFGTFFLATQSLIIHESLIVSLLSGVPIIIASMLLKDRVYVTPTYPAVALALALWIDIFLIKQVIGISPDPSFYTMGAIFGNIVVVKLFSLKFNAGKTRQSLMPLA